MTTIKADIQSIKTTKYKKYLNDDKLGRVLDKLFIKGLDTVFLAVSLNAVEIYQISLSSSHLDSTSFHVHGEYENSLPSVIFENQKEQGKRI